MNKYHATPDSGALSLSVDDSLTTTASSKSSPPSTRIRGFTCYRPTGFCLFTIYYVLMLGGVVIGCVYVSQVAIDIRANLCNNQQVATPLSIGPILSNLQQKIVWKFSYADFTLNCTTFTIPPSPQVILGENHLLYMNDNLDRCCFYFENFGETPNTKRPTVEGLVATIITVFVISSIAYLFLYAHWYALNEQNELERKKSLSLPAMSYWCVPCGLCNVQLFNVQLK
jgi:hypothetical protein